MIDEIFKHFGIKKQEAKMIEEMQELSDELFMTGDWRHIENIKEELADVSVVLEQLINYYGREEINKIKQAKIKRTLQRIKEGYYEQNNFHRKAL